MIDKIKALNDFEKQALVSLLSDFDVDFLDERDGIDIVKTMITVKSKDRSKSFYYFPYILGDNGFSVKRETQDIVKKVIFDFKNADPDDNNTFKIFH